MDDEHKALFTAIYNFEKEDNEETYKELMRVFGTHFRNEEVTETYFLNLKLPDQDTLLMDILSLANNKNN